MTKRVVSAIVMVLIFVPFLIMGGIPFTILMAVLGVLGLYELLKIRGDVKKKFPVVMRLLAYLMVIFLIINNANSIDLQYDLDYRLVSLIIFLFLAPMVFINNSKKYNLNDALFLVGSVVFIGLSFNLLTVIRNFNIAYIIYLFLITTMTDTFALFTGMFIGKHKLAPEISPKKTIEGAVGGSIMGTLIATAFYTTVISSSVPLVFLILITLALTVVGQIGDLAFSAIKRYYGQKDFSDLIPGHGGILDRLDSLVFVVLAFILVLGII
ncbi:MAG: phosphatidate cytidylyltransferase [Bacilli bacterium]|nr:phosphatidate cytidylyltransferase [Bacilli bacterium]